MVEEIHRMSRIEEENKTPLQTVPRMRSSDKLGYNYEEFVRIAGRQKIERILAERVTNRGRIEKKTHRGRILQLEKTPASLCVLF